MTTQQHANPATPATRPLTGEEYIESLRDGREVFIYGDKVADVTTHPAFRNSVRVRITRSSTRRSTGTGRRMRSETCSCTSKRSGMTA